MKSNRPRLMIAAPASGGGKTTLAIGLLRALAARGMKPAAFKCGPDYIDPLFHREVLGVPSRNLDLFFTAPDIVRGLFCRGAAGADISLLEGVMGHYDGVGATSRASGWHLASETETPAVLVLHPKGTFLTLAAMVKGLLSFRRDSMIRGLILNRCGEAYFQKLKPMLEKETGLRVYGCLPDMPEISVESRHLGLVTPDGVANFREMTGLLAKRMEESLDIPGLIALAETAPDLSADLPEMSPPGGAPVRIAMARDRAFCFYYQENLELLRSLGAEIALFSPLRDERLPDGIGGLYLAGGYPELYADELAANARMRDGIRDAIASGLPTVAECGGFMYLHSRVADAEGREHAMVGALEGVSRRGRRPGRFGYVRLRARHDNLLCRAGAEFPAHEFHYWDSDDVGDSFIARKDSGGDAWNCVVANAALFAGFPHLYFWADPDIARRFVAAARERGRRC